MEQSRVGVSRSGRVPSFGKRNQEQDIVSAIGNNGINDNHSVAYCLVGYLCAWLRYYYPYEFITSYLNNAANDGDIKSGTQLAKVYGISITPPRFGVSTDEYMFDEKQHVISKGVSSVKFMNKKVAGQLYKVASDISHTSFMEVLQRIDTESECDDRQLSNLIRVDYFSQYGNSAELMRLYDIYKFFKRGQAKNINKAKLGEGVIRGFVAAHAKDTGAGGNELKSYIITDMPGLLADCEKYIRALNLPDIDIKSKISDQLELLGYIDITTGLPSDRKKLIVLEAYPLSGNRGVWGYALNVRSIGTGNEARLTVRAETYDKQPLNKMDVIQCIDIHKNNKGYWYLDRYSLLV